MDAEVGKKITILVPTFNRYSFLLRVLKYYVSCGSPFRMHVLDSSSEAGPGPEAEQLINSSKVSLTKFDSSIPVIKKLIKGLEMVASPYTVLWADDDFLVPRTLEHCVNFLDEHSDYCIAHGQASLFLTTASRNGRAISRLGPYVQTSETNSSATERFKAWMSGKGTIFYSVQRTENLNRNLVQYDQCGLGNIFGELVHGGLSVIQGKTMRLDYLYMMREAHSQSTSVDENAVDFFDFITHKDFALEYDKFHACLSQALAQQDHISSKEANDVIKQVFWSYFVKTLSKKWQAKYGDSGQNSGRELRSFAKMIPGARRVWAYASNLVPGTKMSLPALLSPRSPYHSDFMPIHNAIMSESRDTKTEEVRGQTHHE